MNAIDHDIIENEYDDKETEETRTERRSTIECYLVSIISLSIYI